MLNETKKEVVIDNNIIPKENIINFKTLIKKKRYQELKQNILQEYNLSHIGI